MKTSARKILIIGPAWVGDMVMAHTLVRLIKAREPEAVIDIMAPDWTRALIDRMPGVNRSITIPLGHGQFRLRMRYRVGHALRDANYDQAILLPNSYKSALTPFFAQIPLRTGWRGEMRYAVLNDVRILNEQKLPLMIQRFAALGIAKEASLPAELPYPLLEINAESRQKSIDKFRLQADETPILALCPGAEFGPAKRWPTEHFIEVAREQTRAGWQVWIFGAKKDAEAGDEIQQKVDGLCVNLCGKTSLAQAIDLLSLAKAVVTNDSGLMHISAALQRPMVALYGSSDPSFTPPLSNQVKILSLGLDCSPCFKRECPLEHLKCLRDLKPQLVLDALQALQNPTQGDEGLACAS